MALVEMNWRPTRTECRNFGLGAIIMLPVLGGLLSVAHGLAIAGVIVMAAAGVVLFALSRISERLIRPVFIGLTLLTLPIGIVMSFVILMVFYFVILTPIGLVFRLIGRDALNRTWDAEAATYWTPHRPAEDSKRYFNQF